MSSLRDILEQGLSSVLDQDLGKTPSAPATTTPEKTAPTQTVAGTEPSLLSKLNSGILNVNTQNLETYTLIGVGILLAYLLIKGKL